MMDAAAMHGAMPYALIAVIIALAIAVVALYARCTRVLRACRQEHGCGARRKEGDAATSAADSRRQEEDGDEGSGGDIGGTAAPAEAEIGSSGTFADLCADGEASR